jgi:DNA-binding NarL/FixJ family response regulator
MEPAPETLDGYPVTKLKIFLADDHPILRDGLRVLIDAQPDMEVVGEAADGPSVVESVVQLQPDIAVMDVSMPRMSGTAATEQIKKSAPNVRILALSAHEDRGYLRQMLSAGAAGYVVKRTAAEDLIRAIRCVAKGEIYLDPAIAGSVVADIVRTRSDRVPAAVALSERETEVLTMIARGEPVKQIASKINVSARTVETYKTRAMEKLGLRSRADVIRFAIEHGWLNS